MAPAGLEFWRNELVFRASLLLKYSTNVKKQWQLLQRILLTFSREKLVHPLLQKWLHVKIS